MDRGHTHAQKLFGGMPEQNLKSDPSPHNDLCNQCNRPLETATVDVIAMTNRGHTSAGSDHDNVDIRVRGKDNGLAYCDCHIHIGRDWNGITQEVGAETFTGRVGEDGILIVVQDAADAESVLIYYQLWMEQWEPVWGWKNYPCFIIRLPWML